MYTYVNWTHHCIVYTVYRQAGNGRGKDNVQYNYELFTFYYLSMPVNRFVLRLYWTCFCIFLNQRVNLELTVCDYDRIGSSSPIGRAVLGYSRRGQEAKHWREMIENPRRPVIHWHILQVLHAAAEADSMLAPPAVCVICIVFFSFVNRRQSAAWAWGSISCLSMSDCLFKGWNDQLCQHGLISYSIIHPSELQSWSISCLRKVKAAGRSAVSAPLIGWYCGQWQCFIS